MKRYLSLLLALLMVLSLSSCGGKPADRTDDQNPPVSPMVGSSGNSDKDRWELILVNTWHSVPPDFTVELTRINYSHSVDSRIYPYLQQMLDAMRAEGLSPLICSSYRTQETQQRLYDNRVDRFIWQGYSPAEARQRAEQWVALPGTSEHQTGLAVDIVSMEYQDLDREQENTAEQKWLMENSYKYGFILRYPTGKSALTGIKYEPWHYRYVGQEVAREIYARGICLEEYLGK
ncbi:MAG: D-alanyl-D-alanine carboxypeptidase family protein [Ruminococcaceae bacterium]|nr:D-alanyl-D-alanine carboxypeptidase family protein [Oscillospiraceae bacterium]